MRGKISIISEKKPRFAPVFRIFSPFSAFLRIRPLPSEIDMRLCVFLCTRPCACLCACPASAFAAQTLPAKKRSRRPSFPYYIYCLPIRTAQDFSTRSLALLVPSVEMTRTVCIFRDPFDCAAHMLFAAPLRVTEKKAKWPVLPSCHPE